LPSNAAPDALNKLARLVCPGDCLATTEAATLTIDGCAADDLIREFGSPLYVIAEKTLRANYRRILSAFTEAWPNDVTVLYAIKANNNLAVRAILDSEGAGGDCFGDGELYATFFGGAAPERVVMNGSNKSPGLLQEAVRLGVTINIDAFDEVEMLKEIASAERRTVTCQLRLAAVPAAFDGTGKMNAFQWGFSVETATQLVRTLRETPGIELTGYHMHFGRQSPDPAFYRAWANELAHAIVALYDATGFAPATLDVGGGYPRERDVESGDDPATGLPCIVENSHAIEEYAAAIAEGLLPTLEERGLSAPHLSLEPGRYIVGNAGVLLTTVGPVKKDRGLVWVNVDASINNLMMRETRNYEYRVLPATRMDRPFVQTAYVTGPLCLGKPLAAGLACPDHARGDLIAILDAGMYAETMSSQMNGVPRPATVLVAEGHAELIKERESVHDVFSHHRIPQRLLRSPTPAGADRGSEHGRNHG
jgi:diaminopimelate decarboxylase